MCARCRPCSSHGRGSAGSASDLRGANGGSSTPSRSERRQTVCPSKEAVSSACALTYVQVFRLNHDQLMQVLESGDHPEATTALLQARRWIINKWAFVDCARRVLD